VDTYFAVPKGRLKLRVEAPGDAMLVRYQREDVAGARESLYEVTPVADAAATLAALAARHGVRSRVEKSRTLYLLENVRIHLDEVVGLGTFIEFEAVMDGAGSDEASAALIARLRDELGVADGDLSALSYGDMLAMGGAGARRGADGGKVSHLHLALGGEVRNEDVTPQEQG